MGNGCAVLALLLLTGSFGGGRLLRTRMLCRSMSSWLKSPLAVLMLPCRTRHPTASQGYSPRSPPRILVLFSRCYSEWFRFTYQQKARVNTWKPTTDSTNVISYPNDAQVFLQWVEGWIGGIMTSSRLFNTIPGYLQAQLLATIGMAALPPTKGEQDTPRCETSVMNAVSSGQHLSRKTRS